MCECSADNSRLLGVLILSVALLVSYLWSYARVQEFSALWPLYAGKIDILLTDYRLDQENTDSHRKLCILKVLSDMVRFAKFMVCQPVKVNDDLAGVYLHR